MPVAIGNAPCSWGVEFPHAPSNPPWRDVLDEAARSGYRGIELGPVGYMPEDSALLADQLSERGLTLTAGVLFRPFHDPAAWEELLNALRRTCRLLQPLHARHLVFIDSLSPPRAPFAGDSRSAPRLSASDLVRLHERIRIAAQIVVDEFGLSPCMHAHAGGYIEFEDELEHLLETIDERLLGLCVDTGHSLYAGFDPTVTLRRHAARVRYVHVKDLDKQILNRCIEQRTGFYEACNRGVFCKLGHGDVDFAGFKRALDEAGYEGWITVEQDRGPDSAGTAFDDAQANIDYLRSANLGA